MYGKLFEQVLEVSSLGATLALWEAPREAPWEAPGSHTGFLGAIGKLQDAFWEAPEKVQNGSKVDPKLVPPKWSPRWS